MMTTPSTEPSLNYRQIVQIWVNPRAFTLGQGTLVNN